MSRVPSFEEQRPGGAIPTSIFRRIPDDRHEWYGASMSGTYTVVMGDRGRLVVPAELRRQAGMHEGVVLVFIETEGGIVLLSRDQLKELVRRDLAGMDLVTQLLAGRRVDAAAEDAA